MNWLRTIGVLLLCLSFWSGCEESSSFFEPEEELVIILGEPTKERWKLGDAPIPPSSERPREQPKRHEVTEPREQRELQEQPTVATDSGDHPAKRDTQSEPLIEPSGEPSLPDKPMFFDKPATLPRSLVLLHIGDSQSSGTKFSKVMVAFLRNPLSFCPTAKTKNNIVFSYAKVSSAARHWSATSGSSKRWLCNTSRIYTNGTASSNTTGKKLCTGILTHPTSLFQKLIGLHKPTVFLIQLGGNSAGFREQYVKGKIQAMLDQMPKGSGCYWVTPSAAKSSLMPKRKQIIRWTKEVLSSYSRIRCHVIDSADAMAKQTSCKSFNGGDGLHMTSCGSALWGAFVREKVCRFGGL